MAKTERSYCAMLLSMIIPGLGQIYLRKLLKGIILIIGVISALLLIYANSLPVTSWRDLVRLDRPETSLDEQPAAGQMDTYSDTDDPTVADEEQKQWRGYPLYTSDRKFMFRITADLENHLIDNAELSAEFIQQFKEHKVLIYKGATISTEKEGSWWLISDHYQTYSVRKSEYGLDIYSTAQWRFRPRWQFKITGLIQLMLFWGFAVVDGWLGRR